MAGQGASAAVAFVEASAFALKSYGGQDGEPRNRGAAARTENGTENRTAAAFAAGFLLRPFDRLRASAFAEASARQVGGQDGGPRSHSRLRRRLPPSPTAAAKAMAVKRLPTSLKLRRTSRRTGPPSPLRCVKCGVLISALKRFSWRLGILLVPSPENLGDILIL